MLESTYEVDLGSLPPVPSGYVSLLFAWDDQLRAVALREGQELLVGRAEPAELIIKDPSLSRTHARLSLRGGELTLEDLGSTNGCSVNGVTKSSSRVNDADLIQLGSVQVRICSQPPLKQHSELLSEPGFIQRLSEELTRCRVFGRSASLVALKHDDDQHAVECLPTLLGPLDRLCVYAPTVSLVLLPERNEAAALTWTRGVLSKQDGLRAGYAAYPDVVCNAETLVSHALDACHRALPGAACSARRPSTDEGRPVVLSPCMQRMYELVERVAPTTLPVLIQGETGTGKELVALALHHKSPRRSAPFRALNCATIPTNLLETVLFGHERGAFSGADRQSLGIFEDAQHGTVFLDEIGELSSQAQAALLRVLEERRLVRVGSNREIDVDVRIVAATHRDLAAMVVRGTFRADLMFRLDAVSLRVPPLRARREEIVPLAELFLLRARSQWRVTPQRLSQEAAAELLEYHWPGNVRQLKHVIERAAVISNRDELDPEDLGVDTWPEPAELVAPEPDASAHGFRSLPERVREFEGNIIREALTRADGNQSQAARILGIPRRTLVSKLQVLGLASRNS